MDQWTYRLTNIDHADWHVTPVRLSLSSLKAPWNKSAGQAKRLMKEGLYRAERCLVPDNGMITYKFVQEAVEWLSITSVWYLPNNKPVSPISSSNHSNSDNSLLAIYHTSSLWFLCLSHHSMYCSYTIAMPVEHMTIMRETHTHTHTHTHKTHIPCKETAPYISGQDNCPLHSHTWTQKYHNRQMSIH